MKNCWILSQAFSASTEIIMKFVSLSSFVQWIESIDLCLLSHPCKSGMKSLLILENGFFLALICLSHTVIL